MAILAHVPKLNDCDSLSCEDNTQYIHKRDFRILFHNYCVRLLHRKQFEVHYHYLQESHRTRISFSIRISAISRFRYVMLFFILKRLLIWTYTLSTNFVFRFNFDNNLVCADSSAIDFTLLRNYLQLRYYYYLLLCNK